MQKALKNFHDLPKVEFNHSYDLTVFFEEYNFPKQSKIAELAGMNPGLLRQYASGVKNPSPDQAKRIEKAVHDFANELKPLNGHFISLWCGTKCHLPPRTAFRSW